MDIHVPRLIVLLWIAAGLANLPAHATAPSPVDGFHWTASGAVHAMGIQPDGKIVLGGEFTAINGIARNYLARLNPDGSVDTTFNTGSGPSYYVMAIAVQSDGKILAAGSFSKYNGVAHKGVVRLNPDGSADTTFNTAIDSNAQITSLAIQPDGKILAGGKFYAPAYSHVLRLNQNGSEDGGFTRSVLTPWSGILELNDLIAGADGEIYIAGQFSAVNGISRLRLARLKPNGAVDTSFDPGNILSGDMYSLALQKNGKLLAGGHNKSDMKRFNKNGSVDAAFSPSSIGDDVQSLTLVPDGKILIGGNGYFMRLNVDGSADTTFKPAAGSEQNPGLVAVQADGRILLGNGTRLYPDGALETTFNVEPGADLEIRAAARQSDGRVVIGGDFTNVNGVTRNRVARINADGTLDVGFDPKLEAFGTVNCVTIQTDGKILVHQYQTNPWRSRLVRLNAAGSIDTSFNPGTGPDDTVNAIAVVTGGKILLGGEFSAFNGTASPKIVRLNADGSVDAGFASPLAAGDTVSALQVQVDGKILIGGRFQNQEYTLRRLGSNGALDTTFHSMKSVGGSIASILLQADAKIVVAGYDNLTYPDNWRVTYHHWFIRRLNADGSTDASFDYPDTVRTHDQDIPNFITLSPGNKILIANRTTAISTYSRLLDAAPGKASALSSAGTSPFSIKRATSTGASDSSFTTSSLTAGNANQLLVLPDGKILAAGGFTAFNGSVSRRIAQLNPDGSADTSFNAVGSGVNDLVFALAVQPDNKILAGGEFTALNGETRGHVARLSHEGWSDSTFATTTTANGSVYCTAAMPDGGTLLAGAFTSINGATQDRFARLNADGSLDAAFTEGADGDIYAMCVQPNGKILIGGNFTGYGGRPSQRIARVNVDGTPDTAFSAGSGLDAPVMAIAIEPGKKILLGGAFTSFHGEPSSHITRLQWNGMLDTKFNAKANANGVVNTIVVQPDGRILIGGLFTTVNGAARNRIARLYGDGALDPSFNPGSGANGEIASLSLQANGKILVSGDFTTYDGQSRRRVARVNADGSLDLTYDPGTAANGSVDSIVLQSDGKLLMGGAFGNFKGFIRNHLARLTNPESAGQAISVGTDGAMTLLLAGSSPCPYQVMFEQSADGVTWELIGWGTPVAGVGFRLSTPNPPIAANVRATGWVTGARNNGSISLFRSTYFKYPAEVTRNAARDWMYFK